MKRVPDRWVLSLALALLAWSNIAPAQHAHQHEHPHEPAQAMHDDAALASGELHATDEALRTGMNRIRAATASALQANDGDAWPAEQRATLAAAIRGEVDFLIANCRLEPAADQRLHGIIGMLLGAAARLERSGEGDAALEAIVAALDEYPQAFDHPGWMPLRHAH